VQVAHLFPTALIASLVLCIAPVSAAPHCADARIGINLAGAEFGKHPGREGHDYRFPTAEQIAYFKKVGFRAIRLPVRWERLQPVLHGALDERYLSGIVTFLDNAQAHGVDVLIDLHNYARYDRQLLGTEAVPASAFFDVWQRLARALNSHQALHGYGLMNEPYNTAGLWHQVAQSGVDGVRSVDRTRRIYVAGERFSSAAAWEKVNPAPFVSDPVNLEVYEGHFYLDKDGSGKYVSTDPVKDPATFAQERMEPFIRWLERHGKTGAIGEWGVPADDERWLGAVDRVLEIAGAKCMRTYVWAGGNWSPVYKLSLQPLKGADKAITRHFSSLLGNRSR
jgi:endoglucanase